MATITAKGRNISIINLTLSSTADTQIGFAQPVNAVSIRCRTAVDLQLRTTKSSPDYVTIPSGTTLTLDLVDNVQNADVQATNLWLRSASTSPVAEIIGYYGG